MSSPAAQPSFPWHRALRLLIASLVIGLVCSSRLRSEEPSSPEPASTQQDSAPPEIAHLGQVFILAQHREDKTVETDEYLPKGETLGDWSQLLTVQRLRLPRASSPDEMIAHLSKRVSKDPGSRFLVVRQGRHASVFSASLPPVDGAREQRLVGIVCMDTSKPGVMDVLQFALAPSRVDAGVADMILDSWKLKFVKQADVRNGADRVGD
ncbi:MAG: hypothetical protein WC378_11210 [Opitutaceae bacterium]|jgi:hypothetical protein